jgi:hypothetical protein
VTSRAAILGVVAAVVAGGAIALAVAVRGGEPAAPRATPTTPAPPPAARTAPRDVPAAHAPYTKFVSPPGQAVHPSDPTARAPIPDGGFAHWTGREGTAPGELEAFAQKAGIGLPLALEQRRSTLLEERTRDTAYLGELLGKPPTAEMLAAIDTGARVLHDATANIQVSAREHTVSEDAAIAKTRSVEDAYRRAYEDATGLSDAQFERFFAADRPLP